MELWKIAKYVESASIEQLQVAEIELEEAILAGMINYHIGQKCLAIVREGISLKKIFKN